MQNLKQIWEGPYNNSINYIEGAPFKSRETQITLETLIRGVMRWSGDGNSLSNRDMYFAFDNMVTFNQATIQKCFVDDAGDQIAENNEEGLCECGRGKSSGEARIGPPRIKF